MEYMASAASCIMQMWLQRLSFHKLFWNPTLTLPLQGSLVGSLSPLCEPQWTFMPMLAKSLAQAMLGLLRLEVINATVLFSFSRSVVSNSLRPMDYPNPNPPGSCVHGLLQARILEWVAVPFSRASSPLRLNPGLLHCRQILYHLNHREAQMPCTSTLFSWDARSWNSARQPRGGPWGDTTALAELTAHSPRQPASHLKEPPWRGIFSPWLSGWTQPNVKTHEPFE